MAWFPWRKKQSEQGVPEEVEAAAAVGVEEAVAPDVAVASDVAVEPDVVVEPDLEPTEVAEPVDLEPALSPVPTVQPVPTAPIAWNPNLRGVVVRLELAEPGAEGAAADLLDGVEQALSTAVGPDSPAPEDADPEHPIVVQVTIAEEIVDAEVTETIAAMRKQLARKAARVRLVVDQVPRAEL